MPAKTRNQKAKAKAEKQWRQKANQSARSGDSAADLTARSGTAGNVFVTTNGSTSAAANARMLPMTSGSEGNSLPQLIGDRPRSDEPRAVRGDPRSSLASSGLPSLTPSVENSRNTSVGARSLLAPIVEAVEGEPGMGSNRHRTPTVTVEEVPDVDDIPEWRRAHEASRTRYRITRADGTGGGTSPQVTDSEGPRNTWKDAALYKAAVETLGRERDVREDTATFQQRMDAFWRAERAMRAVCAEEDRVYAERVAAEYAVEDADHQLACQLAQEDERQEKLAGSDTALTTEIEAQEIEALQLEALAREARTKAEMLKQRSNNTASSERGSKVTTVPNSRQGSVRRSRPMSNAGSVASSINAPSTVIIIGNNEDARSEIGLTPSVQEVPPPPVRIIHANAEPTLRDRVILQRYRKADIEAMSWSHIPDQGIAWNADGTVIDLRTTIVTDQPVSKAAVPKAAVPAASPKARKSSAEPDKQFLRPFSNERGNAPVAESSGIGRGTGTTAARPPSLPAIKDNSSNHGKITGVGAAVPADGGPDDDGSPLDPESDGEDVSDYRGSDTDTGGSKTVACYGCGGNHYHSQCPHRKRGPVMFAGREIVEEDGDKSGQDEGPQAEPAPEQFKQMQESPDQGEEQAQEMYDSDFTLEECSEYSEYGDDECCFHIAEEDELPPLQEVEDSDYESDSEVEFDEMDEISPCRMEGDISSTDEAEYELYDLDRSTQTAETYADAG
ncbi:hypothetical protein K438DRAFT_1765699 [Mycena galopus ATCC 62051]|nr:hypothetical protein K438DRAFT_1765699 [Mycena galopus ATCC 62051]